MFQQYSVFISFLFVCTFQGFSQSNLAIKDSSFLYVINSAGQDTSNQKYNVSFSIGEPLIENHTDNTANTWNEGFIQPYFISPQLVSFSNDSAFCKGATIDLSSEAFLDYPFSWSIIQNTTDTLNLSESSSSFSLSDFNYEETTIITYNKEFPKVQADTFTIYLEDIARCPVNLEIYELITPNDDGKNDFFYIENINKLINNEVYLFSKWGNLLYHEKNYYNQYSPIELEIGEYIYVIKDQDRNKTYTGNLIIRK